MEAHVILIGAIPFPSEPRDCAQREHCSGHPLARVTSDAAFVTRSNEDDPLGRPHSAETSSLWCGVLDHMVTGLGWCYEMELSTPIFASAKVACSSPSSFTNICYILYFLALTLGTVLF